MHRLVHQISAVVEDVDRNPLGQCRLKLLEPFAYPVDHLPGIGAAQPQYQSFDRLLLTITRDRTVPGDSANANLGHVTDAYRNSVEGADDNVDNIVDGVDAPFRANQQGLLALHQASCSVIAVVLFKRLAQRGKTHATGIHA